MAISSPELSELIKSIDKLSAKDKLGLIEHTVRSLKRTSPISKPDEQRIAMADLLDELAAMPVVNSAEDGFSNRDHDKVLYGGEDGVR